jgi:hypothetical protein
MPMADGIERSQVFDMPDLTSMPTAAARMAVISSSGFVITFPEA